MGTNSKHCFRMVTIKAKQLEPFLWKIMLAKPAIQSTSAPEDFSVFRAVVLNVIYGHKLRPSFTATITYSPIMSNKISFQFRPMLFSTRSKFVLTRTTELGAHQRWSQPTSRTQVFVQSSFAEKFLPTHSVFVFQPHTFSSMSAWDTAINLTSSYRNKWSITPNASFFLLIRLLSALSVLKRPLAFSTTKLSVKTVGCINPVALNTGLLYLHILIIIMIGVYVKHVGSDIWSSNYRVAKKRYSKHQKSKTVWSRGVR